MSIHSTTTKFKILMRNISTTGKHLKENLNNSKKFKLSSQQWLKRQINDVFVKKAKVEHYRCRSAFKLLEIDKSYKILRPGQTVVDLGCAPGSWTQVAVKATRADQPGSSSIVIGIDLSPVHHLEGATFLSALNFTSPAAQQRLVEVLAGRKVDVVLSDMAPSASGHKFMDHTNIVKLCYAALSFAKQTSSPGASLVMKVFEGEERPQLTNDVKQFYKSVRIVRPTASRKDSTEIFLVCLNFMGVPSELDETAESERVSKITER